MMLFKNKSKLGLFILGAGLLSIGFIAGKKAGEITPAAISGAETLIGIEFSQAEKDSMIQNLTNHRNSFERMREQKIENAISPALYFNPLPHGFTPSQTQAPFDWGLPEKVSLPEKENDIAFLPVSALSVLIKNKQISSEGLTTIYLNRIKKYADTLQCLITLMEEEALMQARKMDAELAAGNYRGPLHGIPYGIKDLLAVKGTKTTWGAMPYKDQVIEETATVVEK
ncbi:amidase family protein, partial [Cecembia sp.]|uniref:amidase family protein n=1 Tax=Cecembia sp. TaxID=1898110 RepID=UPI0025C5BFD6